MTTSTEILTKPNTDTGTPSPYSGIPEPYKSWIEERNRNIKKLLEYITNGPVQLCTKAISPEEVLEGHLVYGAVVKSPEDGLKSVLYSDKMGDLKQEGIASCNKDEIIKYCKEEFRKGNKVRLKDPRASDGQGQETVGDIEELIKHLQNNDFYEIDGLVVMPALEVEKRVSIGAINLGEKGLYLYFGEEQVARHNGRDVYGGVDIGLFKINDISEMNKPTAAKPAMDKVVEKLGLDPRMTELGSKALFEYLNEIADKRTGRASVDVIKGKTTNETEMISVVDVSPRVGGTTSAELLAISALLNHQNTGPAICYAKSRLVYDDEPRTPEGGESRTPEDGDEVFINSNGLVATARVIGVENI